MNIKAHAQTADRYYTLHGVEQRRNACNDYMSCTPFIALVLLIQFRFREDARRFFQVILVQPRALLQRCTSDFTARKEERKEKIYIV